jgi:membrane-associated phospholipid phosphatase
VLKNFAKLISTVFNPIFLLIPVPFVLVLRTTASLNAAIYWALFSFIFVLIVGVFILVGIKEGYFSDLDISRKTQRPVLFSFAVLLCSIYVFSLYFLNAPKVLFIAIFALFAGLITIEIVNKFTKASIHVATVSAFATSLFLVYGGIFILSFLFIPLVAWSRIKTHNHTKDQAIVGALIGVIITVAVYVIFEIYS